MDILNERENAFENKYAHDEELKFKIKARQSKLLGLWVAEKLGKTGADAENYASSFASTSVNFNDTKQMIAQVASDLAKHGLNESEEHIAEQFTKFAELAEKQIKAS